jgi:hypothetical protein
VRLALLRDRLRAGAEPPGITLDEITQALMAHEEGHLCDRARFLPLGRHLWRALRFLVSSGASAGGVMTRLEYRAELVALCVVADPRIPLAEILDAAETPASGLTSHGAAYERLLADFLRALDAALVGAPEQWPELDPDAYLVHQLHRLGAEDVREIARELARREGILDSD